MLGRIFESYSKPDKEEAASHAQSLEGSRFAVRQFYCIASTRLPRITQRHLFAMRLCSGGSIELQNHGTFSGAARCQIAELPNWKAAPLQAFGGFFGLRVCKLFALMLLLLLETCVLTAAMADPLTPLSRPPEWDELQKFQGTITHDRFLHLLNDVYAVGGTAQKWITVEPAYAEIQTSGKHRLKLKFAKDGGRRIAKYWHDPKTLPADNDKPLAGLTIALDPGHLGGSWAKMEERWFQIGNAEPVKEGDLTLQTAKRLAPRLEDLGAKVVFVHSKPGPVTSLRPDDLHSEARASLKSRGVHPILRNYKGPADPEKEHSIAWEAERLFYRVAEIHERAKRVNRTLKPDLTLCLHFNAEPWGNPANPTLTDINHFHLIVNGAYAESELAYADVRYQMLLKLLSQSFDEELDIAESIAHSLSGTTKLPAYRYNSDSAIAVGTSGYVWARNLLANRLYHCPVAYVECYVMNSRDFFDRFQAGEYDGLREFNGVMHQNIYAEYADGVAQGLADYFRGARGGGK